MNDILLSVQPHWCENILNGIKRNEIRKTIPKELRKLLAERGSGAELFDNPNDAPTVYIYCTNKKFYGKYLYVAQADKRVIFGTTEYWTRKLNVMPVNAEPNRFDYYLASGKVAAKFKLNKIYKLAVKGHWSDDREQICKDACLSLKEACDYAGAQVNLYAWHIDNLVIFDKPKELSKFRNYCPKRKECFSSYVRLCSKWQPCEKPLTRPPQSWQYIEVRI